MGLHTAVERRPGSLSLPQTAFLLGLLLVNLLGTGVVAVLHDKTSTDALHYIGPSDNLYRGLGFTANYQDDIHSPAGDAPYPARSRVLYPYLVSLAFRLFGPTLHAAAGVAALFKALLLLPIFWLAWLLLGPRVAWVAAILYTASPFYFEMGIRTMPETTCAFFYYAGFALLVSHLQRPRPLYLVLAGACASLALLTRPEAVLLVLLGVVVAWLAASGPKRWRDLAAFLTLPILVLLFGSLILYGSVGSWEMEGTSLATLPSWWDYYSLQAFDVRSYLARMGGIWPAVAVRIFNLLRFTRNVFSDGLVIDTQVGLLPLAFLPVLALPFFDRARATRRKPLWLAGGFILLQGIATIGYAGYPASSTEVRHGQIIAPFLLILAAAGLVRLAGGRKPARAVAGALALLYAGFSLAYVPMVVSRYLFDPHGMTGVEDAARWAASEVPPDAVLLSRKSWDTNYFARRETVVAPTARFADVMDYAQRHGVTHFVITAEQEDRAIPSLREGVEKYADHFHIVHTSGSFSIVKVLDYAFPNGRPRMEGDRYIDQFEHDPRGADWADLGRMHTSDSLSGARTAWARLWARLQKGDFSISQDTGGPQHIRWPVSYQVGDGALLKGYSVSGPPSPGSTVYLTLYWQALKPMSEDFTVFVHMLGPDGKVYGSHDNPPLHGTYPTSKWNGDDTIEDGYTIPIDPAAPAGTYQIEVGMYRPADLKRLPVTDADGQPQAEDRALLPAEGPQSAD